MKLRQILIRAFALLVLAAVLALTDLLLGAHVDAAFPVRITGRVVDETTGQPVSGAWVMTLPRREQASDDEHVATWSRRLVHEGGPAAMYGGARTLEDGSYSFLVEVPWGWRESASGWTLGRTKPPPYYSIGCLIVDAEGFERTIIDPRSGPWHPGSAGDKLLAELRLPCVAARRR